MRKKNKKLHSNKEATDDAKHAHRKMYLQHL
jgi:hypothetical protein